MVELYTRKCPYAGATRSPGNHHKQGGVVISKNVSYIKYRDAPSGWFDRTSRSGHQKDKNIEGFRPCKRCGEYPGNHRGDDACISNLGEVMNACCGHGKHEGYIQFDNGITIRGYFKVESHPFGKKQINKEDFMRDNNLENIIKQIEQAKLEQKNEKEKYIKSGMYDLAKAKDSWISGVDFCLNKIKK